MPRHAMPSALRAVEGTHPERISADEPQAPSGEVVQPPHLSPAAAEVWASVAPWAVEQGLLTLADVPAMVNYCEAVARSRVAAAECVDQPATIESERGGRVANPCYRQARDADTAVFRWAGVLGLTPSARASMRRPRPKGDGEALLT